MMPCLKPPKLFDQTPLVQDQLPYRCLESRFELFAFGDFHNFCGGDRISRRWVYFWLYSFWISTVVNWFVLILGGLRHLQRFSG
jgi:hypothetical protein